MEFASSQSPTDHIGMVTDRVSQATAAGPVLTIPNGPQRNGNQQEDEMPILTIPDEPNRNGNMRETSLLQADFPLQSPMEWQRMARWYSRTSPEGVAR